MMNMLKVELFTKGKKTYFDNEEGWDLNFKTYDELVQSYKNQNVLPEKVYLEAIQNTNLLADMVEKFEIDKSHKYPEFSKTPREDIYKIINKEINDRKINVTKK